ncbi:protein ALP1-like [Aphis craccivora]|uniref:Protein ALP1-like n=1 Tax=Aphis craccivora TaxID=307492 RepID=A0A6G0YBF2_APHCR|nr:protein ALP1-like [Aphis craccivora]
MKSAGYSLTDLHMAFRCGITTLSRLTRRVCQAIWNLKDICMPLSTNYQWVEIADGLLAVCDSNYRFLFVDIGAYGKSSDSLVFKNSDFWKRLQNQTLNIPAQNFLPGTETLKCPHMIVGDEAFGLSHHVLRPYGGKNLTKKKRICNYRLSEARLYIECAFRILANKWRIFHRPINVNIDFTEDIIKACCILHNFVRERDGYNFEHTLTDELNSLQQQENV